ncbi:hypothetical protein [Craterilacuibacter sp. RT1T]|uniref:hypothetical protein n=1 Tax=Craterilacuibacter sp. RT1T TaxID=2942211 RepID=UPI0020BE1B72|nr:hypothetical protein [Craterilacuibacter sp. RT1T]MCL6261923.1 hypothetical protein [Craterilacuibacter sp. RT1T]
MKRHERELKKQLLLIKGEALRTRLELETSQWKNPLQLARGGVSALLGSSRGLKAGVALTALVFPKLAQKSLFKRLLGLTLAAVAIRRWLMRR